MKITRLAGLAAFVAASLLLAESSRAAVLPLPNSVSNLLGNSVTHGTAATPVRVRATTKDGAFELSVANSGEPIPADAMERLFQPFQNIELVIRAMVMPAPTSIDVQYIAGFLILSVCPKSS